MTAEMRERPILFSAPMVRALLDGRKTQTRRVVKDAPIERDGYLCTRLITFRNEKQVRGILPSLCPYGKPGDRLWVREAWTGTWHPTPTSPDNMHLHYAADGSERFASAPDGYVLPKAAERCGKFVTPLFMPRWASRITLEITEVRVERLQEISEEDAKAEGARSADRASGRECILDPTLGSYKLHYQEIWESINGAGSWDANPWVWALTFARVQA